VLSVASYAKGGTATNQGNPNLAKAASLPRPLRFQGRFASKAASLPRPLRFQVRTKLKLTMKNMKGMKFFYSSFFMVFMFFMVEHFLSRIQEVT
jgi:hypothetical protein